MPIELIDKLITACQDRVFKKAEECITSVVAEGYSVTAVLEQLFARAIESTDLSDSQKALAVATIAEADKNLVDGADGVLQLYSVASVLQQLYNNVQA